MGLNYTALSGNCTRDPELRTTASGMSVLGFGLAFNDRRKNPQTGEWEEVPNFIDCTIFGNRATALANIISKGSHVAVEGKLRWSSWDDKNGGGKRSKIELIVNEIDIMSPRPQNAPQAAPQPGYAPQQQQRYANPPQQQMAPQMAPQAPVQGYVAAPGVYQPAMPQPPQPPQMQQPDDDLYPESIPF